MLTRSLFRFDMYLLTIGITITAFLCGCNSHVATADADFNESHALANHAGDVRRVRPRKSAVNFTVEKVVPRFRMLKGSISEAVYALNRVGIDVCFESTANESHVWNVDDEGAPVLRGERLIDIEAEEVSVRAILDQICAQDQRYSWSASREGSLVNIVPKQKSSLDFDVDPFEGSGDPHKILMDVFRSPELGPRLPMLHRGQPLPKVSISFQHGKGRELLNLLVQPHTGVTWQYSQGLVFRNIPEADVTEVELLFPVAGQSSTSFQFSDYDIGQKRESDGAFRLCVAKKKRTQKP